MDAVCAKAHQRVDFDWKLRTEQQCFTLVFIESDFLLLVWVSCSQKRKTTEHEVAGVNGVTAAW